MPSSTENRLVRYGRITVLIVWAWFLSWLMLPAGTRHLAKLLHPDLWWLVKAGTVVVALFTVATIGNRPPVRTSLYQKISTVSGMLLLLLPILYFMNIGQEQLGEEALRKRSVAGGVNDIVPQSQEEARSPASTAPPATTAPGDFATVARREGEKAESEAAAQQSVPDDFQALLLAPSSHIDKKVTLVGMVHLDDSFAPETFYCFRFRINCCAADAMPFGLLVRQPPGGGKLKAGSWARVDGILRLRKFEGGSKLIVEADTVIPANAPEFPYVL